MESAATRGELEVAFNLAYRILGSPAEAAEAVEQAVLAAGQPPVGGERLAALLAATFNACQELLPGRQRHLPEARPPEADPSQEAIAAAAMRLPVRQREALALEELGSFSYEQIATVIETSAGAVAQLISRARINLSDELRGTVLASIAAPTPQCERALPLIAMRYDAQLEAGSRDATWLDAHLTGCERCRLGVEAMREAAVAYRSWVPIAVPAALLAMKVDEATAAEAPPTAEGEAAAAEAPSVAGTGSERRRSRRPALAAALAALLLLAGVAAALVGGDSAAPPLEPAADAAPAPSAAQRSPRKQAKARSKKRGAERSQGEGSVPKGGGETASTTAAEAIPVASEGSGEAAPDPGPAPGRQAVEPTQRASDPKPRTKPKPVPTTASAPQPAAEPAPAPVSEEPPPEEAASEHPGRQDPPGKAVGRPPK